MSYRERQRLADIQAATDAIRSHLQATVDEDLPDLERAVRALADSLPYEDPPRDSSHT